MAEKFEKYNMLWPAGTLLIDVHKWMIAKGDEWLRSQGRSLLYHFLEFRKLVWPYRYEHEWTRLIYNEIIKNSGTILMGSASSQKTSHASEWVLIDYWCHPENTCVLVSSTTKDKLESAVFGEIKKLWDEGQSKFPHLAGNLVDYKQWIVTDDIKANKYGEDDDRKVVRDVRRGILGKPCYQGRQYVGLGVYAGIKQERFRFLCDELQFMAPTFMDCLPNMRSNTASGGLKVIGSGNPNHEPTAQLTIIAEPKTGWASVQGNNETTVWETNFHGFKCVNLIGTSSPNFIAIKNGATKEPYPRLIGPTFAKIIEHDYGLNSPQWETQVMGRMCLSLADKRVITREICQNHGAHDSVIWEGEPTIKVHGCDPAYGRGDRCIQGHVEFGKSVSGNVVLKIYPPQTIKIDLSKKGKDAEDQIAMAISEYLDANNIPATHSFYDSFGKGTIGNALARQFGYTPPIPIDAGAMTTERPVRRDLFVTEESGEKRLKTCREHYSKFITEMWFSVRYAIEANQIRELPMDIMLEGCSRKYITVKGDKIEVEPKDQMREILGRSPDLFDWLAICVEGARRLGFEIERLGGKASNVKKSSNYMHKQAASYQSLLKSKQLQSISN